MPCGDPFCTPIQLGCLKSFLDAETAYRTYTYSAHFSIPVKALGIDLSAIQNSPVQNPELYWFAILLKNFDIIKDCRRQKRLYYKIVNIINEHYRISNAEEIILKLERSAIEFLNKDIGPKLDKKGMNVVGFTISHKQLSASIFACKYLKKKMSHKKLCFVFGGDLVGSNSTLKVLKRLVTEGLAVIGEGELKLKKIVDICKKSHGLSAEKLNELLHLPEEGIYSLLCLDEGEIHNMYPGNKLHFKTIESLPDPDYSEYFDTVRNCCEDKETYDSIKKAITMLLEGGRGCVHMRCDFCAVKTLWCDHRRRSSAVIYNTFARSIKKYRPGAVYFVDCCCNPWIEPFLDLLIKNKIIFPIKYELRAIRGERLYAKLALTGSKHLHFGLEAFSSDLLKKMNKGTTLMHNLESIKYSMELGIVPQSNILIDHPKSNLFDVKSTKKLLSEYASHFSKFDVMEFRLAKGSSIYESMPENKKRAWKEGNFFNLPEELLDFFVDKEEMPLCLNELPKKLREEWTAFKKWYENFDNSGCRLNVSRMDGNTIIIEDNRKKDTSSSYLFSGNEEKIYTYCHHAATISEIANKTNLSVSTVKKITSKFIKDRLMFQQGGAYLSLALRPKEEILLNYCGNK